MLIHRYNKTMENIIKKPKKNQLFSNILEKILYLYKKNPNNRLRVSNQYLTEELCSLRSVDYHLKKMEELGFFKRDSKVRKDNGKIKTIRYFDNFDFKKINEYFKDSYLSVSKKIIFHLKDIFCTQNINLDSSFNKLKEAKAKKKAAFFTPERIEKRRKEKFKEAFYILLEKKKHKEWYLLDEAYKFYLNNEEKYTFHYYDSIKDYMREKAKNKYYKQQQTWEKQQNKKEFTEEQKKRYFPLFKNKVEELGVYDISIIKLNYPLFLDFHIKHSKEFENSIYRSTEAFFDRFFKIPEKKPLIQDVIKKSNPLFRAISKEGITASSCGYGQNVKSIGELLNMNKKVIGDKPITTFSSFKNILKTKEETYIPFDKNSAGAILMKMMEVINNE